MVSRLIRYLAAATFLLCLVVPGARAAEAETHFFDEALSLTGNCSTGNRDLEPDPGCPGGAHPPAGPFANPSSVTTDELGDIYVVSAGPKEAGGGINPEGAHIDVFDSSGYFLTELAVPGAQVAAVDSAGHLYVGTFCGGAFSCEQKKLLRFDPTVYSPEAGEIEYGDPPIELPVERDPPPGETRYDVTGLAVDPTNQHLFENNPVEIVEFGPAVPGAPNAKLETGIGSSVLTAGSHGVAVDAAAGLLYTSDALTPFVSVVRVFGLAAPHNLERTIDGSTTPAGKFITSEGHVSVAVEEATDHFFVGDIEQGGRVYEFEEDGSYVATYSKVEALIDFIHVDNGQESPNAGYLLVPSGASVPGHMFAYQPKLIPRSPIIKEAVASDVEEREAVIKAVINPEGSATHYAVEYVTEEDFEADGFAASQGGGEGDLSATVSDIEVSVPVSGLSPGVSYRFRVRAESQCQPDGCSAEYEGTFNSFADLRQKAECGNSALRLGASESLPDCRAYELVTPSNTNGHLTRGPDSSSAGARFGTPPISADGNALAFSIEGGPLPGTDGAGGFNGDAYLARRTPSGWQTTLEGPTGEQNGNPSPGGLSPDLGYISWHTSAFGGGTLVTEGNADYIRYPDGTFHLTGQGVLTNDLTADLHYLAPGGSHIIFSSSKGLLASSPEAPTSAIYDRTSDQTLHLVSLLPGEVTPSEDARFRGRSDNGSSVAFTIGVSASPLYIRIDDARTVEGGPPDAEFAGFSADGRYMFYRYAGNLYRFDAQTRESVEVAQTGDSEPVNIPAAGEGAYYISPTKLNNEANPNGSEAIEGEPNLYYWDGDQTRFIATVTAGDVKGEFSPYGGIYVNGFSGWMKGVGEGNLGLTPARSSSAGSTLLFRSRARLTSYDPQGFAEIYRFDAVEGTLACVSCNPTGSPPNSAARLETFGEGTVLNQFTLPANLSENGKRAFFESSDRLAPSDNDGLQDVYEWEAAGEGSCRHETGCVFLISSGQSGQPDYLFGASTSGNDVAFVTSDLLTGSDEEQTPSVYDARVDGGFPESSTAAGECLGDACQPTAVAPRSITPASSIFEGTGNVKPGLKTCPRGTHKKRGHAMTRCVKPKNGHKHRSRKHTHRKRRPVR